MFLARARENPVDMEQIVLWDPEVIIFDPDSIYSSVAEDKAWQELAAIKNGRFYESAHGSRQLDGLPPFCQPLHGDDLDYPAALSGRGWL